MRDLDENTQNSSMETVEAIVSYEIQRANTDTSMESDDAPNPASVSTTPSASVSSTPSSLMRLDSMYFKAFNYRLNL